MRNPRICDTLAILFSLIFAVIIAVLFALNLIPNIMAAITINLILAVILLVLYSGLLGFLQYCCNRNIRFCFVFSGALTLTGILGSIVTSVIAFAVILVPNFWGAFLVGLISFFFFLMIFAFSCLASCLSFGGTFFPTNNSQE